ncbi:TPA: hypothetical protein TZ820_001843 [Streptococcus suis]|nr:hypothetical protein [Streptococcus suis]HEL2592749.1 hypothetical protein [Streptococcus suis]
MSIATPLNTKTSDLAFSTVGGVVSTLTRREYDSTTGIVAPESVANTLTV